METNLIYVYCIAGNPPGIAQHLVSQGLQTLAYGDFNVVLKYVSAREFSEENFKANLSDVAWLELNARAHITTINNLMQFCAAVPFKFGTLFNTEESLRKFVADYTSSINEHLIHLQGKEEWAVKLFCDRKSILKRIDELSEEAAEMERQIMASSPGKAFLLKRKKTALVENEIDRLCKGFGQEYFDDIKYNCDAAYLNNLLPKEFTGREESMILNASFLVDRNRIPLLMGTIDRLSARDAGTGFYIETTGPWPPFSFISIKERTDVR